MFALTSGTTASRKLIPVTDAYLAAYRRGWNMWGVKMYRDNRGRRIAMRPIVQLGGDPEEFRTPAGIPCGNLSGYTAMVQKRLIRRMYAVPYVTGKIKDAKARYYVALRFSIGRNVSQLMAANPSTLVQLARTLDAEKEHLLRDLRDGTLRADLDIPSDVRAYLAPRAKRDAESRERVDRARGEARPLVPDGRVADGRDRHQLLDRRQHGAVPAATAAILRRAADPRPRPARERRADHDPAVAAAPRAACSTSGRTTSSSSPKAKSTRRNRPCLGAHELREGGSYFILPTTAYGLYRYHISDLVRVTGFHGKTPLVEFLGKGHRFANLTGEKLSEYHVTKAMDAVAQRAVPADHGVQRRPVWDEQQPYYALFLEEPDAADEPTLKRFLGAFDAQLGLENIEYAAKRESGRLGRGAGGGDPGGRVGEVGPRPARARPAARRSSTSTRA